MKIYILRQETNTPGVLRFKSFPKNIVFDLVRLLLFNYSMETWCCQEKQKCHVTCVLKETKVSFYSVTKTQKYPVTKKLATK